MALENSLNAACDLNEYLICKMPAGALEVQLKVKTTWGKFTMVQDTHTKTEKYHMWEKAQRSHIRSRERRAPHRTTNKQTEDNTSETDIPRGQGFAYPPQIITDPTYAATTTHTESEGEVKQNRKFLGKYCEFCARCNETHCWCNSSDSHIILCAKSITHANLVNVSFLCYKISRGNILKPIGMLYNTMLV